MTPEQVLQIPPKMLTQQQREFNFNEGYPIFALQQEEAVPVVAR